MTWRKTALLFLALSMIPGLCGTALAGVGPSPFHVVITNRTDRLDPASTFYNSTMHDMELTLTVSDITTAITRQVHVPIQPADGATLAPGHTLDYYVDPANLPVLPLAFSTDSISSWSFTARMGIEPSPFRLVAFETTQSVRIGDEEPAPSLPIFRLTAEMPILGFASPGVVVGTVALVNTALFYDACPSVPPVGSPWKNHGQYVRCVAWQAESLLADGTISSDEADAIVRAAAESEVGKK